MFSVNQKIHQMTPASDCPDTFEDLIRISPSLRMQA